MCLFEYDEEKHIEEEKFTISYIRIFLDNNKERL